MVAAIFIGEFSLHSKILEIDGRYIKLRREVLDSFKIYDVVFAFLFTYNCNMNVI